MLKSLEQKFWERVVKLDKESCWVWLGSKTQKGYGRLPVETLPKKKTKEAHRISWEIHFGEIEKGPCICHHCDNPICVNPNHLFKGTTNDNIQDAVRKRAVGANLKARERRKEYAKARDFAKIIREIVIILQKRATLLSKKSKKPMLIKPVKKPILIKEEYMPPKWRKRRNSYGGFSKRMVEIKRPTL
jgi:hypothetical protein